MLKNCIGNARDPNECGDTATGASNNAGPINRTQSYIAEGMIFEMRKRLLNLSLTKPR
jgi:hypothetical protein